jgi:hypothetical protein
MSLCVCFPFSFASGCVCVSVCRSTLMTWFCTEVSTGFQIVSTLSDSDVAPLTPFLCLWLQLPSLSSVRLGAEHLLRWLHLQYWQPQTQVESVILTRCYTSGCAIDFRVRKGVVGVEESVWRKEERLRGGLRGLGGKPGTPLIEAPPVSFGERERGASAKGRGFPCSLHRALFSTGPNLTPA